MSSSVAISTGIVANDKCNACHGDLGINPSFHGSSRNDAPSCNFCHDANRTSAGWSGTERYFIHAIHGASKRTVPFTWHAASSTDGFYNTTYPGILNKCEMCHNPNGYDFTLTGPAADQPSMLPSTVAVGRLDARPATNASSWYTIATTTLFDVNDYVTLGGGFLGFLNSGFITADASVDYGFAFKQNATTSTASVTYSLPDAYTGTGYHVTDNSFGACSAAAPCKNTTAASSSVVLGSSYFVQGVTSTTITQGSTTCTDGSPCTCTSASKCTLVLKTCAPGTACDAAPTTLVISPIVEACSACHDTPNAIAHMRDQGGTYYEPRSVYYSRTETCLICHGPNKVASIALVHTDLTP
jgi:OmcA/MtrC family decaheme c-type cytochrome